MRPKPAQEWLAVGDHGVARHLASALAAAGLAWGSAPWAVGLHDQLGWLVPAVALPVVVVEADGDLGEAARVAEAAGAASVFAALPKGHPRLDGVPSEPPGLVAGKDGVVRWFRGTRLPLPEALVGLPHLHASQLDPGNPAQLVGRHVVLDFADPAMGVPALAPATPRPVDRAELIAVALGTQVSGHGLWTLPIAVVVPAAGVIALLASRVLRRLPPIGGSLAALVVAAGWLAVTWAARALGADLPIEAGLAALGVPALLRVAAGALQALQALDQVALRLGAPGHLGTERRAGLESRAEMISWFVPGCAVAFWRPGPEGALRCHVVSGPRELLPVVEILPGSSAAGPGWRVEPVVEDGAVVGAVGIGRDAGISESVARMVEAIARAPLGVADRPRPRSADPLAARLQLVADAVDQSRKRSETWEALLAESGLSIGMFELGGDLISAGGRLRERVDPHAQNPLRALLRSATGLDDRVLCVALCKAVAAQASRRLPCVSAAEEIVMSRIVRDGRVLGLLVQIHDVGEHQRLDGLKSDMVLASGARLRNALTSVSGYAEMAVDADPHDRDALIDRLRARVAQMVEDLDRAEALAKTRVGQDPIHPVFLEGAVLEAVARLTGSRDRIDLDLPDVSSPVAARASTLVPALQILMEAFSAPGCRVRVCMTPTTEHVALTLEDDSGGLPQGMLEKLLDPHAASPVAGALQELVAAGTGIHSASVPGAGTRLQLTFPLY